MNKYVRHAVLEIGEVLAHVRSASSESAVKKSSSYEQKKRVVVKEKYSIGVSSLRMKTFAKGEANGEIRCVCCGLKATFFAVENHSRSLDISPHANLYGLNGEEEVLFTHDHIIARSKGGKDNLSNTQVMCLPCNFKKSLTENPQAKKCQNAKQKKKKSSGC